jgi:rubrerythrin
VLGFALSKEQASVQFYQDLGNRMTESTTQTLFSVLLKNELEHVEMIRLEMEKLGYTIPDSPDEAASDYEWQERLEIGDATRDMTFMEALMLAIQKERAAFRLYTHLLGQNQSSEHEAILMELAEEEMRHVLQLEREYESITRRRDA